MGVWEITRGLLTGTGAIGVIAGLSAWLGKVWANRILHQDRVRYETQMQTLLHDMRTRGEKELFVHRLQFEKEFEVYLGLWKELLHAGRAASEFRELKSDSGKSREQQLEELRLAMNRFNDRVYDYRPFYAPRIYDLTADLLKKLRTVHSYSRDPRRADRRTEDTEKLLDEINEAVPQICDAIRERIFPRRAP